MELIKKLRLSEGMENLPRDLEKEVLLRLPLKSLLRFGCVSKSWFEFIRSHDFVYSHLDQSSNNRFILSCRTMPNNSNLSAFHAIDINNGVRETFVLNSDQMPYIPLSLAAYCNGLVLLNQKDKFFALNPSTRDYKELPTFPSDYRHQVCRRGQCFGFGYDAAADDYKVILLKSMKKSYEVWIFRFKSDCWTRIPDFPYIEYNHIYKDGCVHFPCYGDRGEPCIKIIVAFDVAKETFSFVSLPIYQGCVRYTCLQTFEGHLSIKLNTGDKVDLYVRKKERDEFTWSKLFSIKTQQFWVFIIGMLPNIRILGYTNDGDKILIVFSGDMYSYDPKDTNLKKIETTGNDVKETIAEKIMTRIPLDDCIYCVESLVSVGSQRRSKKKMIYR